MRKPFQHLMLMSLYSPSRITSKKRSVVILGNKKAYIDRSIISGTRSYGI